MTFTISPRGAALVLLAVIAFTVAYVVGATRSGAAPAIATNASTPSTPLASTPNVAHMPQFSSNQPSTIPTTSGSGITVGGRANVAGTPDTLRLDLSVVATAASVSEALASANRSAEAVQKSLLANGVQKKDLQTSGLNISPEYDYTKSGEPRLKGYQVSESVSAKLRDLRRAGDAIGKAVSAGGDAVRVDGISLDLEDSGTLVSAARDKAFAQAKAKAEQYAKAAGRALGDVVSITEDVATSSPIPMPYEMQRSAALDKASVPIQPGSQEVSVSVTVVFSMR